MRSNTSEAANTRATNRSSAANKLIGAISSGSKKAFGWLTLGITLKQWLASVMICALLSSVFALPVRAAIEANARQAALEAMNNPNHYEPVNETPPIWKELRMAANAIGEDWLAPGREADPAFNGIDDKAANGKDKTNPDTKADVSADTISPREALEKRVKTVDIQIQKNKTIQVGQTIALIAVSRDAKGKVVDGITPAWTSSNPGIVKISDDSNAVGVGAGKAALKANVGTAEKEINIKVEASKNSRLAANLKIKNMASPMPLPNDRPILADTDLPVLVSPKGNLGSPMGQSEATSTARPAAAPFRERAGIGNFGFGVPIASLPGRGISASVGLSYNSQLWTKSGSSSNYQYTYNVDGNWLAPGFELSYGYLDLYGTVGQSSSQFILTDGDGTRHQLTFVSSTGSGTAQSVYVSNDGSFIQADAHYNTSDNAIVYLKITYSDGKIVEYSTANAQKRYFPASIIDVHGNYISIAYVANDQLGKISDITDTLGRHILFHYDGTTQQLISVTVPAFNDPNGRRQTIRFYYEDLTLSTQNLFNGTIVAPPTVSVLKYIYFPGTHTGYRYSYSPYYGMIYKVSRLEGMQISTDSLTQMGAVTEGSYIESASTRYNYPGTDVEPPNPTMSDVPKYNKRTDDWVGRDISTAAPSTYYTQTEQTDSAGVGTRTMSVLSPDTTTNVSVSTANPGGYDDGLTKETYLTSSGRTIPWAKTTLTWQPGQGGVGRQNPLVQKVETMNDAGQIQATTFGYDAYNNQTLVAEHDFASAGTVGAELRRTETTYVSTGDWITNHLYRLPLSVKRIVNNAVVSRTEYQYDQNPLTDRQNVAQYNRGYNPYNSQSYTCNCQYVGAGQVQCQTCYSYNSYHNARGNVTTIKAFADPTNDNDPKAQVTTFKYDITGNAVEAGLSCCNLKTWAYTADNQYAYPISETKGTDVQLTTRATYDTGTGMMITSTDENNQVTTYDYESDTLRASKVTYPNGGYVQTDYSDKLISTTAQLSPGFVRQTTTLDTNKTVQSYSYYDGHGSPIRSATQTPDGWSISATAYDPIGRPIKSYNPFYGSAPTDAPTGVKWTEVTNYDGLNRATQIKLQDDTLVNTYYNEAAVTYTDPTSQTRQGTATRVMDQANKERRQIVDALGRVIRVDEPDVAGSSLGSVGSPNQPTYYFYDGNDNLSDTIQSDGTNPPQKRRFKYDALSRMLAEKQIEAAPVLDLDGTVGTPDPDTKWTKVIKYNAHGDVTDGYDARGVNTHFSYDGLNRVRQITFSDGTPQITYTYDQARTGYYNKGALTKTETAQGDYRRPDTPYTTTEFDYDRMGRVRRQIQVVGTQAYYLNYAYNLAGQLTSETYPSGKVVSYNYDSGGRMASIADASRTYLSNLQYQGKGTSLSSMNLGNGTSQTMTLNDRLQMINQTLTKGSDVLQKYDYGYGQIDASGNLDPTKNNGQLAKIDSTIGTAAQWTQKFSYDAIGRLSDAKEYRGDNGSLSYKQKFDYDRFGNLYRKNASNPTAGQASPLLYTPIEEADISKTTNQFTTGTTYDNAGNVTQDTKFRSLNFSYDASGRVYQTSNTDNTNQANSVYDASGNRVATQVDGVWTFFIYDIGGKLVSEYGGLAAMDEGGVKYILSDWQGSSRAILSNTGFVQARMDYTAFGEEIGSGVGQRTTAQGFGATNNFSRKYGLTERDKATGLDHTWFRKNENRAGRWTSPDPSNGSMSPGNPQSFNRYSYVENQPTNFVDPSGLNMAAPGNNSWSVEIRISWFDSQWEDYWGADNGGDFGWLSDGNSGGNNETGGGDPINLGEVGVVEVRADDNPCDISDLNIPPNVNIASNVSATKKEFNKSMATATVQLIASQGQDILGITQIAMNYAGWFFKQVDTGGPWDYKQQDPVGIRNGKSKYEDFGNFHYGVVAMAAGFGMRGTNTIQRMAGYAQERAHNAGDGGEHGGLSSIMNDFINGNNGGQYPYKDQFGDQRMIERGIAYYKAGCK